MVRITNQDYNSRSLECRHRNQEESRGHLACLVADNDRRFETQLEDLGAGVDDRDEDDVVLGNDTFCEPLLLFQELSPLGLVEFALESTIYGDGIQVSS